MIPKRTCVSITVPCERGVFDMVFQCSGCKRTSTKNGDGLTLITSPPDTTNKLCGFIGMQHMPKMRRFHNQDAQSNWSTTYVDPTKGCGNAKVHAINGHTNREAGGPKEHINH